MHSRRENDIMQIYLIEDDDSLAEGILFALKKEGYEIRRFATCRESREALAGMQPDLILLDWNLPDGDGLKFCGEIRKSSSVPILMITARDLEIDQVMCLESGADDYIAKPFSLAVLKARIAALLRRYREPDAAPYLFSGDICIREAETKAYRGEKELDLSLTEFRLLKYFLKNKNQVLLKEQILARVWDDGGNFVEENTLMVNIRRLRTKIEEDASHPKYIKTVHGMGYLWEEKPVKK